MKRAEDEELVEVRPRTTARFAWLEYRVGRWLKDRRSCWHIQISDFQERVCLGSPLSLNAENGLGNGALKEAQP